MSKFTSILSETGKTHRFGNYLLIEMLLSYREDVPIKGDEREGKLIAARY
jgi:hypothetical protein